jgi:DNA-binding GntR family transcriptional regulator
VFEIYSYRAVLEGMAIRLAVQNVTIKDIKHLEQFYGEMKAKITDDSIELLSQDSSYIHHYIYKLSMHSILLSMYEFISFRIQLVNRILQRKYTKAQEVAEHLELIEVLKNGDPDEAEKVMREHIYRSYRNFVDIGMFDQNELAQNHWI